MLLVIAWWVCAGCGSASYLSFLCFNLSLRAFCRPSLAGPCRAEGRLASNEKKRRRKRKE